MSPEITRPALRYYGGKWRLAPWVISHFPDHFVYVEPFGGAGSVLLRKDPSPSEVLNDADGDVVNFFKVLRERTSELLRAVEYTPFSRQEVYEAMERTGDPLEDARRFYVRSWQTMHGAPYLGRNGWRFGRRGGNVRRAAVDDWNSAPLQMPAIAKRLKAVQIEHDDALKVIARFDKPGTLFYCDPPYVWKTRRERWAGNAYKQEMTDDQHRALAEVLGKINGMAVLSGYDCPLYSELYAGWVKRSTTNHTAQSTPKTEVLWLSPAAAAAGKQMEFQVS